MVALELSIVLVLFCYHKSNPVENSNVLDEVEGSGLKERDVVVNLELSRVRDETLPIIGVCLSSATVALTPIQAAWHALLRSCGGVSSSSSRNAKLETPTGDY